MENHGVIPDQRHILGAVSRLIAIRAPRLGNSCACAAQQLQADRDYRNDADHESHWQQVGV
jgi:hypothetical protein